jgi:hypothetical protein
MLFFGILYSVILGRAEPISVIAREGGQSSKYKPCSDYWMPRLRGA